MSLYLRHEELLVDEKKLESFLNSLGLRRLREVNEIQPRFKRSFNRKIFEEVQELLSVKTKTLENLNKQLYLNDALKRLRNLELPNTFVNVNDQQHFDYNEVLELQRAALLVDMDYDHDLLHVWYENVARNIRMHKPLEYPNLCIVFSDLDDMHCFVHLIIPLGNEAGIKSRTEEFDQFVWFFRPKRTIYCYFSPFVQNILTHSDHKGSIKTWEEEDYDHPKLQRTADTLSRRFPLKITSK